jgi:hypothetical protein
VTVLELEDQGAGLIMPAPRFATPRDHSRRTHGASVAKVAAALGTPLMPWQQLVADVGGEVDADGLFHYPVVLVTVPRQAGKTQLDLAQSVQRCLAGPNRRVWHTAQTGQDARDKWDELVDTILESPLRGLVKGKPLRSNGKESLEFLNGSKLRPHPPTRDSLHGKQSDTNNIDELWAFDDEQGAELMQAIVPTQSTRNMAPWPGAQLWLWSTAGDRRSTFLKSWVRRLYAGDEGLAGFDWGIPVGADPMDLEVIAAHHPAYGITQNMRSLRNAKVALLKEGKAGEFARAYGNRETGAGERIIPEPAYQKAATEEELPDWGTPAFGVATAEDGAASAIVAVVHNADGVPVGEVLEHRPGRSWVVPVLERYVAQHEGAGVAIDRKGPAGTIADQWELAGHDLLDLRTDSAANACQDLYDRLTRDEAGQPLDDESPRRILYRRSDHIAALDEAVDLAGKRGVGQGSWLWSRTASAGDITALEAWTWATWASMRPPEVQPEPSWDV